MIRIFSNYVIKHLQKEAYCIYSRKLLRKVTRIREHIRVVHIFLLNPSSPQLNERTPEDKRGLCWLRCVTWTQINNHFHNSSRVRSSHLCLTLPFTKTLKSSIDKKKPNITPKTFPIAGKSSKNCTLKKDRFPTPPEATNYHDFTTKRRVRMINEGRD